MRRAHRRHDLCASLHLMRLAGGKLCLNNHEWGHGYETLFSFGIKKKKCVRRQICEDCVGVHLCITPQRICVRVCTICYIIKLTHSSSCTKWTSFCRISSSTLWTTETEGAHLSSASSSQPSVQRGSRVVRTCPWCWSSSPTSDVWGKGVGTAPGWQPANQHPNLIPTQSTEKHSWSFIQSLLCLRGLLKIMYLTNSMQVLDV